MLTLLVAAITAGCATHGLAFVQDDRVDIVAPADRSTVSLPLTVRWSADRLPSGASFAVAVDVAPPRPGHRPHGDDQVVFTSEPRATLDHLGASSRPGGRGLHRITVFLVDSNGERMGEGAWPVDVELEGLG
jgi:hypothetical protein